jgi:hypothetical protein
MNVPLLQGALHGPSRVFTILLSEFLIRHVLLILIRLSTDYTTYVTIRNMYDSQTQLVGFLATNIQLGMQPLLQYFPRLLSTVKMGKTY